MELIFVASLVVLFFLTVFFAFINDSAPIAIFGVIVAVILGGIIATDGIEITTGVNSTLSADNRTVTHQDITETIKPIYNNAFAMTFFVLAFFMLFIVLKGGKE